MAAPHGLFRFAHHDGLYFAINVVALVEKLADALGIHDVTFVDLTSRGQVSCAQISRPSAVEMGRYDRVQAPANPGDQASILQDRPPPLISIMPTALDHGPNTSNGSRGVRQSSVAKLA